MHTQSIRRPGDVGSAPSASTRRESPVPRGVPARLPVVAALLVACSQAYAVEPYQEYAKRVESSANLSALKEDLFGESVSLFNGKTEFNVTDIDVAGNNALPVALRRRFPVELQPGGNSTWNPNLGGAGGWDVDVPYISGTFSTSGWANTRCSGSMVPTPPAGFNLTEIWQGNWIHVPAEGARAMLRVEASTPQPADGLVHTWTTTARDAVDCIPMRSGLAGEGFRVRTSSGLRYHFDVGVTKAAGAMTRQISVYYAPTTVTRNRIFLLASKVEDRFGNVVNYQYNAQGNPVRIWSSDGREIVLTYTNGQLSSATAHGQTWTYSYATVEGAPRLAAVVLPDSSRWQYTYSSALQPSYEPWDGGSNASCNLKAPPISHAFTLVAKHPSGATGVFEFQNRRQGRSGVHASECLQRSASDGSRYYVLNIPNYFDVVTLDKKTVSGPGLPNPLVWTYTFGGGISQPLWGTRAQAAAYPCTTCATEKLVTVSNPDGTLIDYRFGFQYALNEGRQLGSTLYDANGVAKRTQTTTYLANSEAAAQVFQPRYGIILNGDDPSTAKVQPVVATTLVQDGTVYSMTVNSGCSATGAYCFDAFGRPTKVTHSSTPAP